jgi:CRISPR/Cas system-associated exonuclease Cas4 (RecB family)
MKCPKKYQYRYIIKPDIPQKKWNFTEFGSCAHRVLELFHERVQKESYSTAEYPKLMKSCFVDAVKEFDMSILEEPVWTKNGDVQGIIYLREVIQTYLNRLKDEPLPNVIGTEMSFNFDINESAAMRGFIDRVDKLDDGIFRVIDYKTSKDPKYLSPFQLLVYAKALRSKFGEVKKVLGSYVLLKHECKTVDYEFTNQDIDECEKTLEKRASFIDTDEIWVKKPTSLCNWCDYKNLCQDGWADGGNE